MCIVFKVFIVFILICSSVNVFAQNEGESTEYRTTVQPREQLGVIIFAGLGGGILGLSTLSFYARPQDNLENIAYGFALGVIVGTFYSTYQATKTPSEYYQNTQKRKDDKGDFLELRAKKINKGLKLPIASIEWSF